VKLYLVQHGEAEPKSSDPTRPLTDQGQIDVAQVAAFLRRGGVEVHQIRHSGMRRAAETAAIFAEYVDGVLSLPGLAPQDDVRPVTELLNRETRSLMFVGHRPFMDRIAGLLVAGDRNNSVVRFEKGCVVCLERDPRTWNWAVRWAVTPELITDAAV
jgi:phosphohistidine phosphatase